MNIEQIKAAIAVQEPEAERLWKEMKVVEKQYHDARDEWHAAYVPLSKLKDVLEILETEPAKERAA